TDPRASSPHSVPQASIATSRRRRLFRFGLIAAFLVIIGATAALAARDGLRVERDVRAGRATFRALLGRGLSSQENMQTQTAAGTRLLESADARAHSSVWIGGWSHVPVLGQPARWVRGATDAIVKLARVANDVVAQVEPRLNTARDPQGRLRLLDSISAEFAPLRAAVDAARIPASGWFVPPVVSADAQLRRELGRLRRAADGGAVASRGLHSFLQGPTTYLVLAANNAEMRAGGMVLQAGLLRAIGGRVSTG